MSFSDFGGPSSSRARVSNNNHNNTHNKHANAMIAAGAGLPVPPTTTTGGSGGGGGLAAISETLLQYQRNVGILEGIVQNLPVGSSTAASGTVTVEQYEAQKHVLEQLQDKIQTMLLRHNAPHQNSAVLKLQRDFQTIQGRATKWHETAARKLATTAVASKSNNNNSYSQQYPIHIESTSMSSSTNNNNNNTYRQQQQLQLMEDRLHEQIMREREEEIRSINQGMHTVNEIYKDLAHIVSTQQENIDQIETQMEDSRTNAENGLKQVELANEKFGTTNCCIM